MLSSLTLVVCEDGTEYIDRFRRFLAGLLGPGCRFVPARDYTEAEAALGEAHGLLLDLDFRRAPTDCLIDEQGARSAALDPARRARLAEMQGVLILRRLRARGVTTPAVLFADFDDPGQARYLESTLGPLAIAASRLGLPEIAALIRRFAPG